MTLRSHREILSRMRTLLVSLLFVWSLVVTAHAAEPAQRVATVADITALHRVSDPRLSPDGAWVAHTVTTSDQVKDRLVTHIWMTSWDGSRTLQLTNGEQGESAPRWSPDGKSLAFISSRGDEDAPQQVWLLDRQGGESQVLTAFEGSVVNFAWSPDSTRLAVIVADKDPAAAASKDKDQTPPPIVIDRFYFKEDGAGYLGALRQHLYVYDIAARKADLLTPGRFDEGYPAWSPDGREIAFMSKRGNDPDRSDEFGLYSMVAEAGAAPRLLTTFEGSTVDTSWMSGPVWRPDGKEIAFVAAGDPKLIWYSTRHLSVVSSAGGFARNATMALDRNVLLPRWAADGKSIYLLIEDDRNQHLAELNLGSGKIDRLLEGRREITEYDVGTKGRIAFLASSNQAPGEIFAAESRKERTLTHHNDEWLAGIHLGATQEISFSSKDGTRISGLLTTPPDYVPGRRYPTLLWIHGGPTLQWANSFKVNWQIFAAQGYVVIGVNPRGSTGRGEEFTKAIYADWGNKDADDVLAAVDFAVNKGFSDPAHLGVGGWSYGGMLTNFVIAKDTRFKAAISGAAISNALAGYGTDMYIREWEMELGRPWENLDAWLKISYPFLHADRIKTPTLFLVGQDDFNVPAFNLEQMYQALRSMNVDTQLIIYPGQNHIFDKPTYLRDRMQRYVEWYGKYLH